MNTHEMAHLKRELARWRASEARWAIKAKRDRELFEAAQQRISRQKRGISEPTLDEDRGWPEDRQRARWRRHQHDSRARKRKRADDLKPKPTPLPRVEITRAELKDRAKTLVDWIAGPGHRQRHHRGRADVIMRAWTVRQHCRDNLGREPSFAEFALGYSQRFKAMTRDAARRALALLTSLEAEGGPWAALGKPSRWASSKS
jgi:hypothetical protein